jgi:UDP-N-acetylglucosamine acyltransferase
LIDDTAKIHPEARLGNNVEVGPWTVIGPEVEIGEGTVIASHVVIKGPTRIGKNNQIFQFSSVGEDCQDKKYSGEKTRLEIGDNNVIREACSIHRGTVQDKGVTLIGSDNLFMVNVHIAHDVVIGDNTIVANNAAIAGHVKIDDFAVLGGFAAVHQFCRIGQHSMSGAGSVILKDVPAFVLVNGNTAVSHGINSEGLRRRDYSRDAISALRKAYKLAFRKGYTVAEAVAQIRELDYKGPELEIFIDSLLTSTRGIVR